MRAAVLACAMLVQCWLAQQCVQLQGAVVACAHAEGPTQCQWMRQHANSSRSRIACLYLAGSLFPDDARCGPPHRPPEASTDRVSLLPSLAGVCLVHLILALKDTQRALAHLQCRDRAQLCIRLPRVYRASFCCVPGLVLLRMFKTDDLCLY